MLNCNSLYARQEVTYVTKEKRSYFVEGLTEEEKDKQMLLREVQKN